MGGIAEAASGFVPIVGSVLATRDAIKNPTLYNVGAAGLSWLADASLLVPLAGPAINGGLKTASTGLRAANLANKAAKSIKAVNTTNKILNTANLASEVVTTGQELVQSQNPSENLTTQVYQKGKIPSTV